MYAVGKHWSFLVGTSLIVTGAAHAADQPIVAKPGTGLAFGQFELSDSEVAVDAVHLIRIKPVKVYFKRPWESGTVTYTNGEFFAPNLKPGTYVVSGFRSGNVHFSLEDAFKNNVFEVAPDRVTYAGTYKLQAEKAGFLRRPKGSFGRIDSPEAETAILTWLEGELAGSGWSAVVKARLQQLLPRTPVTPRTGAFQPGAAPAPLKTGTCTGPAATCTGPRPAP
jgi:hypothetical protein